MGLYNGKKPVAQLWGCHDLHTAHRESVLKRTAMAEVLYSTQSGLTLHDFELTTTCDAPHDAVADRTSCRICDSVGCDSNNRWVSQAVVTF